MSKLQNQFLNNQFGSQRGDALYAQLISAVEEKAKNHEHESKMRKKVLRMAILPYISLYYLLQEQQNLSKEDAYELIEQFLWDYGAVRNKASYEKMAKLPFFFTILKITYSTAFRYSGVWNVDIIEKSGKLFKFNINKCLWHDTCALYKCPELCRIFCRCDEISYQGFEKKAAFSRSTMLGENGYCCDFQFAKKNNTSFFK